MGLQSLKIMEKTAKPILLGTSRTEARAKELTELLNQDGYIGGISYKDDKVYLTQPNPPYSKATIGLIKDFAKAWNKLINKISA